MFHLGKQFIILIICGCVFLLLLIIGIIYFLNRPKPKPKLINTFVAVGEGTDTIVWSDDGKIWNKIASGSGFNPSGIGRGTCVASNGNVWVAGGQESGDNRKNMVFSTDNGRTWSPVTQGNNWNNNNIVYGVVWNGTNFIAVGEGFSGGTTAVWSEDGQNWNSSTGDIVLNSSDSCLYLNTLACNEKICVALSYASTKGIKAVIIYSDDSGHSWNKGTGATFSDNSVGSFVAVNDSNYWVAITKFSTGTNILISSGGIDWKIPTTNIFNDSADVELYSVAHDNGSNWVVVGNKGIAYSSDNGSSWVFATQDSTDITDIYLSVVYNGKIWVANGINKILYSYNGLSWTKNDNDSTGNIICWNGTVFVITSNPIIWSDNPTSTWNRTSDTVFKDGLVHGLVHGIACRYKV